MSIIFQVDAKSPTQKLLRQKVITSSKTWDHTIGDAISFMNDYVAPHEFAGLVFYEEEHPLKEREAKKGTRNVTVYYYGQEGAEMQKISERFQMEEGRKYWSHDLVTLKEGKTWDPTYREVEARMARFNEDKNFWVATGNISDYENLGYHCAVIIKADTTSAQQLRDASMPACQCSIF